MLMIQKKGYNGVNAIKYIRMKKASLRHKYKSKKNIENKNTYEVVILEFEEVAKCKYLW